MLNGKPKKNLPNHNAKQPHLDPMVRVKAPRAKVNDAGVIRTTTPASACHMSIPKGK